MELPLASFACLMQLMLPSVYNTTTVAPISLLPFAHFCGMGPRTSVPPFWHSSGLLDVKGPRIIPELFRLQRAAPASAPPLTSIGREQWEPFCRPGGNFPRAKSCNGRWKEWAGYVHNNNNNNGPDMCITITFNSLWLGQRQWLQSCFLLLSNEKH